MVKRKYTRRKTKKKKEQVELVTKCDQCGERGKLFRGILARTFGSAFTAYDRGLSYIDPRRTNNKKKVDKWMFFCNDECLSKFNENIHPI